MIIKHEISKEPFKQLGAWMLVQSIVSNARVFEHRKSARQYDGMLLVAANLYPEDERAIMAYSSKAKLITSIINKEGELSAEDIKLITSTGFDAPEVPKSKKKRVAANEFERGILDGSGIHGKAPKAPPCCEGEEDIEADNINEFIVEAEQRKLEAQAAIKKLEGAINDGSLTDDQKSQLEAILKLEGSKVEGDNKSPSPSNKQTTEAKEDDTKEVKLTAVKDEDLNREDEKVHIPEVHVDGEKGTEDEKEEQPVKVDNSDLLDTDKTTKPKDPLTKLESFEQDLQEDGFIIDAKFIWNATQAQDIEGAFVGYPMPEKKAQAMIELCKRFGIDVGRKSAIGSLSELIFNNLSVIKQSY